MIAKFFQFVKTDIWRIRLKNYPPTKSFLIRQLRIIVLAVRGYAENQCKFRASALTFYSLLSIVPVLAMMFGIAKGFGLEKRVETEILNKLQGQEQVAQKVMDFANSLLQNTSGGVIAGIGVVMMLWSIIGVLSNIESAFNDIWGVKTPRSYSRKFSDYLSLVLVCPILLVIAGSATILINSEVRSLIEKIPFLAKHSFFILLTLKLLPYGALWFTFTFIFIFMPNTKVRFTAALFAGVVAGTAFQIAQWLYIKFQIGAANYGAIYGSFAALPLFLLWLQISWYIVLFGAELSFAHQNVDTYEFEQDCKFVSYSFKRFLTLLIAQNLVKGFCDGVPPLNAAQLSHKLDIPVRLVREILYELVSCGIATEVRHEDKIVSYQPGMDVEKLTIKFVVDSIENRGNANIPVIKTDEFDKISDCLAKFGSEIEKSPSNLLLKNI
jgi:membrane protein